MTNTEYPHRMRHLEPTSPHVPSHVSSHAPRRASTTALAPALLLALPALGFVGAAQAQGSSTGPSPYYLGTSIGYYHASNVFRTPSAPNSDNITSYSLLAGLDQPIGRQRLFADATVQRSTYKNNSQLDYTGYTLRGGVDWATIERLSGTLLVNNRRKLADYNSSASGVQTFAKNIEDNRQVQATARLGVITRYSLEAMAEHRSRSFSAEAYNRQEYEQDAGSLGLFYRPSGAWKFGVAGRYTRGERPFYFQPADGPAIEDRYRRRDIDLTAQWRATGSSSLDARLSRSRTSHSATGASALSGATGSLAWNWAPGGRWSLNTRLARDSGAESYYLGIENLSADLNQVVKSAQSQLNYELTGKLILTGGLNISHVERDDDSNDLNDGRDRTRGYNVGLRWLATRNIELGCSWNQQRRNSTQANYEYDAKTYGCYLQGTLR